MLVETYLGVPSTQQIITPGDTVTSIGSEIHTYVERVAAYTLAGAYVMKVGDMIVGDTSTSKAFIVGRTITSGADATSDAAGLLTICGYSGAFTATETLSVEGNAAVATLTGNFLPNRQSYLFLAPGMRAKRAMVIVITNTVLLNFGKILPGQTSLNGLYLTAGQNSFYHTWEDIKNFACVDAVSGSASVVRIYCYF